MTAAGRRPDPHLRHLLVSTVGIIYARTLLKERRFRDALPEYRLLAAAAEGGPHGSQGLDHRYRAAQCLEQLGHGAEALAEYHALLRAAGGDTEGGWERLLHLLLDRERLLGPHHEAVRRLRQSASTSSSSTGPAAAPMTRTPVPVRARPYPRPAGLRPAFGRPAGAGCGQPLPDRLLTGH